MVKQRGNKKRPRVESGGDEQNASSSGGWRKVNVGLGGKCDTDNNDGIDDSNNKTTGIVNKNHYDDIELSSRALHDLEADPAELPGVFFGLEVLDGSQYTIVSDPGTGSKKFFMNNNNNKNNSSENKEKEMEQKKKDGMKPSNNNKKTKPNTTKDVSTEGNLDDDHNNNENLGGEEEENAEIKDKEKRKKKKQKKRKKNDKDKRTKNNAANESKGSHDSRADDDVIENQSEQNQQKDDEDEELLNRIQSNWMTATGGVEFHTVLCRALVKNQWHSPTPIQAAVLPAAILGRRNIVGAAPTGSGKTLAFLLPIYQYLLEQQEQRKDADDERQGQRQQRPLQALILTPTRELALQIHAEAQKLLPGHVGTLVGGLAIAKQQRVLDKNRPAVITATPGRLWELISSREHEHLNDLSHIRFLVIDEADRMIQQGSFPQLAQILDAVQNANPNMDDDDTDIESDEGNNTDEDDYERMLGLPGIRGEAKVTMLSDDILKRIEQTRQGNDDHETVPETQADTDDENDSDDDSEKIDNDHEDENQINLPIRPPVYRQTFVYSATLTLPASASFKPSNKKTTMKGPKKNFAQTPEGAVAEILEKARARGMTKIVDLTNAAASKRETTSSTCNKANTSKNSKEHESVEPNNKKKTASTALQFRLPDGLELHEIKCTQRHKDSHLYAYLMTTVAGSTGPALIFCNSIAGVRRVGATLEVLGLPVRILHAQMQQRARLKAVESLNRDKTSRTIVVATDVAARGLDIPSVSTVVHYDAARNMDTFIHRSGRTARGVGEGAVGSSLSIVSPEEDKFHSKIVQSLHVRFEGVHMDGRLFSAAQARVNLASKIAIAEDKVSKVNRQNQWFRETAEQAGIEIDDNCIEEGLIGGSDSNRDSILLRDAETAKVRLKALLSQPLQTQKFGKFLSTNSAVSHELPSQFLVALPSSKSQKNKKLRR